MMMAPQPKRPRGESRRLPCRGPRYDGKLIFLRSDVEQHTLQIEGYHTIKTLYLQRIDRWGSQGVVDGASISVGYNGAMNIAVLGTGTVGRAHADKLLQLGHDVVVGTRNPKSKKIKDIKTASFADAAAHGELVIEALNGHGALEVLKSVKAELAGKTLIDISVPLDFSSGELRLFIVNDDSLGEQIQKALPKTKVVKAFSTMNASVQVDPKAVTGGNHHLFIAGNDKKAKAQVIKLARSYGWKTSNILDLGDIKSARGMEMILPIWLKIMGKLGTANFNFKIVR